MKKDKKYFYTCDNIHSVLQRYSKIGLLFSYCVDERNGVLYHWGKSKDIFRLFKNYKKCFTVVNKSGFIDVYLEFKAKNCSGDLVEEINKCINISGYISKFYETYLNNL